MRWLFFPVALLLAATAFADVPTSKPFITMGVILPLTGDMDHLGQPIRELIEYKIDHFPQNSRFSYKALFEDDQCQPKLSLLAAQRLVGLNRVDVLMTYFSGPGSVVSHYATQNKTPHLMWCFKADAADGIYNFSHITLPQDSAKSWTQYAEKLGYKRPAFLVHRNAGALAVLKALEDYKIHSKLEWTVVENFNPGERDFRMILWRMKEKNPDLLYVYAFDPEMPIILRQLHEIGWNIPISTITMFDMEVDNPLVEGAWYVGSDSPSPEYRKWYTQTFHRVNAPYGSALYSDYVDMIYKACESYTGEGKPSREYIARYLRSINDFPGASGTVSCSKMGIFAAPPTLLKIQHGIVTPIK